MTSGQHLEWWEGSVIWMGKQKSTVVALKDESPEKHDEIKDDRSESSEIEELIEKSMETLLQEIDDATPKILSSRMQINIYIVYFSVFLDNMGVSIVQPILPFYAEEFGANSVQLGMLYSSYSLMATFATIFMAKMSDRFGMS